MSERLTKGNPKKRVKKHGYRARTSSAGGRKVLKRRAQKGRKRATV